MKNVCSYNVATKLFSRAKALILDYFGACLSYINSIFRSEQQVFLTKKSSMRFSNPELWALSWNNVRLRFRVRVRGSSVKTFEAACAVAEPSAYICGTDKVCGCAARVAATSASRGRVHHFGVLFCGFHCFLLLHLNSWAELDEMMGNYLREVHSTAQHRDS